MVVAQPPFRPLRGSRISSFYPAVPVEGPSLIDLESAFQLQEYISLLIRKNPHDVETIVTRPGKPKGKVDTDDMPAEKDAKNEVLVERNCWIYEHLRRLAQDLTHPLVTSLQQECTRSSCPEMKAGEWLYLCTAHGNDGAMEQCCAIDYIIHTLDSATALLNSPRAFPSRISIPHASVGRFSLLARRLGRIFAHAYFHHREAFESAEAESSLYTRFLALTAQFELVPSEFLVIPPRLLGNDPSENADARRDAEPLRLLAASISSPGGEERNESVGEGGEDSSRVQQKFALAGPDFSSRHITSDKRSPSPAAPGVQSSPRKLGRSRTDTMVLSDLTAFNEELHRTASSPVHDVETADSKDEEEDVHEQIHSGPPPAGLPGDGIGDEIDLHLSADDHDTFEHKTGQSLDESVPQRALSPEPEQEKPSELPHVDTLELLADSKEVCKPHVLPPATDGDGTPSESTDSVPPTEPQNVPDAQEGTDETDIELLLERKRVLDEAQAKEHVQSEASVAEEDEDDSRGESFVVINEPEKDDAVPDLPIEEPVGAVDDNSSPQENALAEAEAESEVPVGDDTSESAEPLVGENAPLEDDKEIDPNMTFEEDLHDVEKVL